MSRRAPALRQRQQPAGLALEARTQHDEIVALDDRFEHRFDCWPSPTRRSRRAHRVRRVRTARARRDLDPSASNSALVQADPESVELMIRGIPTATSSARAPPARRPCRWRRWQRRRDARGAEALQRLRRLRRNVRSRWDRVLSCGSGGTGDFHVLLEGRRRQSMALENQSTDCRCRIVQGRLLWEIESACRMN